MIRDILISMTYAVTQSHGVVQAKAAAEDYVLVCDATITVKV